MSSPKMLFAIGAVVLCLPATKPAHAQSQSGLGNVERDARPGPDRPSLPSLDEETEPGFELPPVLPETKRPRASSGIEVVLSGIDFEGNTVFTDGRTCRGRSLLCSSEDQDIRSARAARSIDPALYRPGLCQFRGSYSRSNHRWRQDHRPDRRGTAERNLAHWSDQARSDISSKIGSAMVSIRCSMSIS